MQIYNYHYLDVQKKKNNFIKFIILETSMKLCTLHLKQLEAT